MLGNSSNINSFLCSSPLKQHRFVFWCREGMFLQLTLGERLDGIKGGSECYGEWTVSGQGLLGSKVVLGALPFCTEGQGAALHQTRHAAMHRGLSMQDKRTQGWGVDRKSKQVETNETRPGGAECKKERERKQYTQINTHTSD